MSKQLVERLRKGREMRIEVGKHVYLALRPTDLEMMVLISLKGEAKVRRALDFVHGWEGVVEDDIVGGGCSDVVKFDEELWRAYSADHSDIWKPIADKLFAEYERQKGTASAAEKN